MASMRVSLFAALALLALLALACSESRPASQGGSASDTSTCVYCHGSIGRVGILPGTDPLLASAPPSPPSGKPDAVTGAHQVHLNPPVDGAPRGPLACSECHVVPGNLSHATNPPANPVQFGALATARGATPTYHPLDLGCAAVYCHGNFDFNGVVGANATPVWTATGLTCGSCHGMPPTGHPALAGTVTAATCNQCHPSSVKADGTIDLTSGAHLNGQAEVSNNCTSCHGTPGRTGNLAGTDPQLAAAPPVVTTGSPATAEGAHLRHVNPDSGNALRAPLLCNECHVVPADIVHATNPPASPVAFGALATTQGNSPTWNGATLGCSATYCHGGFDFNGVRGTAATPLWTDTNIQCVNCHGLPPTGHPALAGTVTAATCSQCHPSTVNANGTINVAGGGHVNGVANVAANCTSCHGDPSRTVPAGNPNALLASAPPVAPPGSPASVVGTHLLHLTDSAIRAAVTCNECHVVPDNPDHSILAPPVIVFSPGTLATTQGVAPTFDGTTLSCSATYCHGNFAFGSVRGSTSATPAWNATPTVTCTGCHEMPPTGHQALTAPVTAASCASCHSETVNTDGTINVAGGKHMNGLAEYSGNHPAGWADPTQHGYAANQQGLQNCTTCHVAFGAASGVATSSCNTCHGGTAWQTNCTFCHGTATSTGNVAGTDPRLTASPPVGPQGQTAATDAMVGAHQKHVNPLATGRMAAPFACTNCHASPLPADVAHVNGLAVPVPFGGIAITGSARASFDPTSLGCSATYCHGNFAGGKTTAVPVWTGGAVTCTSCHDMPATSTGQHSRHLGQGLNCSNCHNGIATGTGDPSTNSLIVGPTLHVNGAKNVVFGGSYNGATVSGSFSNGNCTISCHGNETW